MIVLVFNAGSASLKFEVIETHSENASPDQNRKLVSGAIEGIGDDAMLSLLKYKQVIHQEKMTASDYGEATRRVLARLDEGGWQGAPTVNELHAVGHRVVHGGDRFTEPVFIDDEVVADIEVLEDSRRCTTRQQLK
jgi:acetate kinase